MKRNYFFTILMFILGLLPVAVWGQLGQYALRFDGIDDYVSIPDNSAFEVSAVTIEMWFKWENYTTPNDVDFLIGKGYEQLEIHTGGGAGENALRFIPTPGVYLDTPPNSFVPGKWNHVAYIYDPSGTTKYACYINGSTVSLTTIGTVTSPITTTTEPLKIGIRKGLKTPFQGLIDEVRIWNTARTEGKIQASMNIELAGTESGLAAYFKMAEGSGTTVDDASSNSNTGTLMNGVNWSKILTVTDLLVSGSSVKWYAAATGGTALPADTKLANGTAYYASQTVNGMESATRLAVTVTVTSCITVP